MNRIKLSLSMFTLVIFALTSFEANSQAKFTAGIKGGLNFSTINDGTAQEVYGQRTGYNAGVFMSLSGKRFGIQPEVLFSTKGATVDLSNSTVEDQFSYLNVPILFKWYLADFINLQVGPQFGYMTSAVRSGNGNTNVQDLYSRGDLSLATGIGLELPFGLNLEGRYNIGVTDINDDPNTTQSLSNQVYQVSIGFRILDAGSKDD